MKKINRILVLMFFVLISTGCASVEEKTQKEGFILKIEKERVLFTENISMEEYNDLKDLSLDELTTSLERPPLLIYLSYGKTNDLKQGDKVIVTISGGVQESFPALARASKIEISE